MDRVLRHSWFRFAGSLRIAIPVLILLLGVGGYLLTSRTIRSDRDANAARRAQFESVQVQEVLGRARAYVAGLANVLAHEAKPEQPRFARLAGGTAAAVGLNDVLWVQRITDSERTRYERRHSTPITRMTPSGRFRRAPAAGSYLPATFTSRTRLELRPGVDVSGFPVLGDAMQNRASLFAVGATRPGTVGDDPGFYLIQTSRFGHGPDSRGFLVTFVPRGWFATTLQGDPRRLAISQDGRRVEGQLDSSDARANFETLGRRWRIDVAREPPSGLQSTLPWLALAWPVAVALIAFLVGRATMLRRRAERDVERIFDLSADLVATVGFDGYFRSVNPSFERTLGYPRHELLSRPWSDFVHPDDIQSSREAFADVVGGKEVIAFENRFVCADGSETLLEWNARAVPDEGVIYGIARDVTESRRVEREFEEIFNLSPDLLSIAGLDGYLKRVNPAFEEAFGYSSEELLSRPLLDFGHPDDRAAARDAFAQLARGQEIRRFETRNIRADGSILWLEWSSRALPEEGVIYGAARDITERKRADAELHEAQQTVETGRAKLAIYAEDQAALRRVATLVAHGASPTEVLDAVAAEVSGLLDTEITSLLRFEPDGTATVLAIRGEIGLRTPVGTRLTLEGEGGVATMLRTGRPARMEDYAGVPGSMAASVRELGFRSGVGAPITVEGRIWGGVFTAWTQHEPPLADAESRIAEFTELVGTAIANAESRAEVARLLEEQAALRHVATLVARQSTPAEVFAVVAEEVAQVLNVAIVVLIRYEPEGGATAVGAAGEGDGPYPIGTRWSLDSPSVMAAVRETGRPARIDDYAGLPGTLAEEGRRTARQSVAGSPIVVEGRLWGAIILSGGPEPLPERIEGRLAEFTELIATAIANTESRAELTASRARVVSASAEERRRVVRDLHDGAQQRLVHAVIMLKLALRGLGTGDRHAEEFVSEALNNAEQANLELRELVHGILPGVLTSGGLRAAVEELVSRASLPVTADVLGGRYPPAVEGTAYFVVSEALTNVVKHSGAQGAQVAARVDNGALRVEIRDNGVGGADPSRGSGLTGLRDRVEALGGTIQITSPAGSGTSLVVDIPIKSGAS
jgi:PAS domain S-box-containing protein